MNEFIAEEEFSKTNAYLDNITVCGKTQEEHEHNLARFLAAAKKKTLKFNQEKCTFSATSINLLGHHNNNHIHNKCVDFILKSQLVPNYKDAASTGY